MLRRCTILFTSRRSYNSSLSKRSLQASVPFSRFVKMGDASPNVNQAKQAAEMREFDAVFGTLVNDLTEPHSKSSEVGDAARWYREVLEYNCPHGKKNRGLTVVDAYRHLVGVGNVNDDDLFIARMLGWCVEMLQAFFLVADDMMDASVTRRGQPCWYKIDKVGMIAANDFLYIESAIYVILKKYIRHKPYYIEIVDLMHDMTLKTVTGQTLDLITAPVDHVDFTNYTIERYNAIVKYKTAFYSFYLPVALAMHMTGIKDDSLHDEARTILLEMGEYFQIQDDFIDCFGDSEVTGKIGTDIEDNKCGWLVVQALSMATPKQRKTIEENYAKKDQTKVDKVKQVYRELDMVKHFRAYEEASHMRLIERINLLEGSRLPRDMFISYAQKIYKREK